ncbi:MAG: hypothetical protein BWZ02_03102 [Lentisphaerae bacterium ADurb.BinA184]|nr:MAG: hypothetical protein BWZ02_03102 [Lentisphaerae bacterium ADurb.BinA184]
MPDQRHDPALLALERPGDRPEVDVRLRREEPRGGVGRAVVDEREAGDAEPAVMREEVRHPRRLVAQHGDQQRDRRTGSGRVGHRGGGRVPQPQRRRRRRGLGQRIAHVPRQPRPSGQRVRRLVPDVPHPPIHSLDTGLPLRRPRALPKPGPGATAAQRPGPAGGEIRPKSTGGVTGTRISVTVARPVTSRRWPPEAVRVQASQFCYMSWLIFFRVLGRGENDDQNDFWELGICIGRRDGIIGDGGNSSSDIYR